MSDVKIWNQKNLNHLYKFRHFPSEMILRATVSNSYFTIPFEPSKGKKVLDIGCLFANNLLPFWDRGFHLYGTEVTDESVEICKKICQLENINAEIKKGFNTSLPYSDNYFDLVMSVATIHYEESLNEVRKAFNEFSRVTKKDGSCIIKTVAPLHDLFKFSVKTDDQNFIFNSSSDLRFNQTFYFFENEIDLKKLALEYFEEVEIARVTEIYPKRSLDFFLLKCDLPKK